MAYGLINIYVSALECEAKAAFPDVAPMQQPPQGSLLPTNRPAGGRAKSDAVERQAAAAAAAEAALQAAQAAKRVAAEEAERPISEDRSCMIVY